MRFPGQMEEARARLRRMYSELGKREDKKELIILPVLSGEIVFSRLYLDNIKEEFQDLHIDSIRDETLSSGVLSGGPVSSSHSVRARASGQDTKGHSDNC